MLRLRTIKATSKNPVVPAHAGTHAEHHARRCMDSRLRGNDVSRVIRGRLKARGGSASITWPRAPMGVSVHKVAMNWPLETDGALAAAVVDPGD